VTGGANSIGRAIARHLLADGWRLGIVDLRHNAMRRAFPLATRNVVLIEGDVGVEETAPRAVGALLDRYGRLDALVSNAGIMIRKPLRRLTLAEWYQVIDANLTAALPVRARCGKAAAQSARRHRHHRFDPRDDVGAEHRKFASAVCR
jgi:NAD(P)-dependent dehydrogenase (short-subunit alcohol dehydrogenase family)